MNKTAKKLADIEKERKAILRRVGMAKARLQELQQNRQNIIMTMED